MDPNFKRALTAGLSERIRSSHVFNINFDVEDQLEFCKISVVVIIHAFTYIRSAQEFLYEDIEKMGPNAVDIISSTVADNLSLLLQRAVDETFKTQLD